MKHGVFDYILAFSGVCLLLLGGCRDHRDRQSHTEIAVTNSYLACAVTELCGDDTEVLCLAPPGMCPAHFDISPSQVKQLCSCRILLLFDFQKQIEQRLSRVKKKGLKTASVRETGGLCVPETYIEVCREVGDVLSAEYPEMSARCRQRLSAIDKDLKRLREELLEKVAQAGLSSAKVLASNHQADFANWLGLETVATFVGSDIETVAGVENCIRKAEGQDVRFVIANKQEGAALAEALAQRLGAKAVVFSNFPELNGRARGFNGLLRANVEALLEVAGQ
ncbi:MAG: zinc ABC transporter substrate-binding protein [Planctomycetes bacterium]|nr:zinc ABC transporter substrate-binding protein [Planctomycetota bacterium]